MWSIIFCNKMVIWTPSMSRKSVTFFCYKGQKSLVFRAPCKKNKRKLFGLFNIIIHLCTLYRSPMSFGKNFHKGSQEGRKGYIFGGAKMAKNVTFSSLLDMPGHMGSWNFGGSIRTLWPCSLVEVSVLAALINFSWDSKNRYIFRTFPF